MLLCKSNFQHHHVCQKLVFCCAQVFQVQVDVKRSRKFPVTVALHNLRPLLHITDTEGLADRLGKAVQVHTSSAQCRNRYGQMQQCQFLHHCLTPVVDRT